MPAATIGPSCFAPRGCPKAVLETLEDRLVDRLVWRATAAGATAFIARAPRAEIDLNRDEREIDPALIAPPLPSGALVQSARTRGGLGLIPSRIAGAGPDLARADRRAPSSTGGSTDVHRPYHRALEAALGLARDRFGAAILLDCHSMPPRPRDPGRRRRRDGDLRRPPRHDDQRRICSTPRSAAARGLGYRTACNAPYAGGYVVGRHGRPQRGFTRFRSSSTARSISTRICARPARASKAPAG